MRFSILLAGAALVAGVSVAAAASAGTVLGTEDSVNGWTGGLFTNTSDGGNYVVGSDGESHYDPFGVGYDTSDGVNFTAVGLQWSQVAGGGWTQINDANGAPMQEWVLPASIPGCGSENEPKCEPVGHFISPIGWNPIVVGTYYIMENSANGGGVSDILITYNDAAGNANLLFYSDPLAIPEPATWAMMILGVGLVGFAARRRTAAVAA